MQIDLYFEEKAKQYIRELNHSCIRPGRTVLFQKDNEYFQNLKVILDKTLELRIV